MANTVNRNLDGAPTQGRSRECARRLRQVAKQREKADVDRLITALADLSPEMIDRLTQLDDAQLAYVEDQIETADALVDTAPVGVEPMEYARKVLAALERR